MELYIRIKDGQPFEHPIFGDNFRQAFPDVDVDNLPAEFARFERVPQPTSEVFEIVEGPVYTWVDGVVKDVWVVRPMTSEEQTRKIASMTEAINASVDFMKSMAQTNADTAPNDTAKQAWLEYLAELNAWVLVDVIDSNIPPPPKITQNGEVIVLTSPGSAPNVIG